MDESTGKKGGNVKKTLFWILAILLIAGIGLLIYWFKTDPKALEKFINVAGGFVIMGIVFGIGYLVYRKRGRNYDDSWDNSDPD